MADLTSLIKGAGGTFAKDTLSKYLSPTQRDFLSLALGPKAYLLNTGIDVLAKTLGYGNEYQELKAGAKNNEEYSKQVARDIIGDMLPDALGDVIRTTPRGDNSPAGVYTAYDPETETYVQQGSSKSVASSDPFANQRFDAAYDSTSPYNTNSQNYVGPVIPSTQNDVYYGNMAELLEMLNSYKAEAVPETVITGTRETAPDGYTMDTNESVSTPIDFGNTVDYSDTFGGGMGGGGKGFERDMEYGGDFDSFLQAEAYKRGGQVCGCK